MRGMRGTRAMQKASRVDSANTEGKGGRSYKGDGKESEGCRRDGQGGHLRYKRMRLQTILPGTETGGQF